MAKILSILLLAVLLLFGTPALASASGNPNLFTTEQAAQQHCPSDTIVWLNLPTGIYHFKGQRWYANTKAGAYVCEQEADEAGDRVTKNGQ